MDSDKQVKQEFTCEICVEPTSNPGKKFKNANKCSHPFCTDCIIDYIRVKLEDENVGHIKCPAYNCDHTLDPFLCASLVGPKIFTRWTDVMCEAMIRDWDRCYCPYVNCNVLIVNECGGNPKKSKCPSCKRWLCFQCKSLWHDGIRCKYSGELRDSNDLAFARLAEQMKWSRCPRCRHSVELSEGCAFINCRCGIMFCYKCRKQVNNHGCPCRETWCFKIGINLICLIILGGVITIFWLIFR